jgi:hypothetical protein
MADTVVVPSKKWYQSKTIVGGIVAFVINVYMLLIPLLPQFGIVLPPIPGLILTVLNVLLGVVVVNGRATATTVIGAFMLVCLFFALPVRADVLTVTPLPNLTLSVPFNSLSVDYLVNINPVDKTEKVQFLGGLRSPILTYKQYNINIGAITDNGYNFRAYYSIGYDYVQKNPNLFFLLNDVNIAAFFSTYFDGAPNFYGVALSKKLW